MKIELKLPPPLKSVAALPCEKLHQRGICYCFMSFYLPICFFLPDAQWRKSVVKSEGSGQSGQTIKLEADQNSFSFSAPKMGYLVTFSLSPENEFSFSFYFSFSFQKCHFRWAENVMFATEP